MCDKTHNKLSRLIFLIKHGRPRFDSDLPAICTKTKIILIIRCILKSYVCLGCCFPCFIQFFWFRKMIPILQRRLRPEYGNTFSKNGTTLKNNNFAAGIQIHLRSQKQTFIEHLLYLKCFGRYWPGIPWL